MNKLKLSSKNLDFSDFQKIKTAKREMNYEQYQKLSPWEKRAYRSEAELRWVCSHTQKRMKYEGKEEDPTSDFMILRVVNRNGKNVLLRQKVTKWVKMEKAYDEDWDPTETDRIDHAKVEADKAKTHLADMSAKIFGKKGKSRQKNSEDSENEEDFNSDDDGGYGAPKGLKFVSGKRNQLRRRQGGYVDISQSDVFASSNVQHLGVGAGDEGIDMEYNEQFDDDDIDMEHEEEVVFAADEEDEEDFSEDEERDQQEKQNFMKGTKRNFEEVGGMDVEENDMTEGQESNKKTKYEIEQIRYSDVERCFLELIRKHGGKISKQAFEDERKSDKEFKRYTKKYMQEFKNAIERFTFENGDIMILKREYQ